MYAGTDSEILLDICTQRDYLSPDGAHPSLNAATVAGNLRQIMSLADYAKIGTLSCVDVRRQDDVRGLPRPACVVGTRGQTKLPCSLLPNHVVIDSDNCLCAPLDILQRHQQVVLSKQHRDPFTNPKLDRLLTELPARRFVIVGACLEMSIRLLVLGLMLRHRPVAVLHDACGYWSEPDADMTLRQLAAKGCAVLSTSDWIATNVTSTKRPHRRRRFVA